MNKIIRKNLNIVIKEFISKDVNVFNNTIKSFEDDLYVYFNNEENKIQRKKNFAKKTLQLLYNFLNILNESSIDVRNIEVSRTHNGYTISLYAMDTENWDSDYFYDLESEISDLFSEYEDYGINISLSYKNNIGCVVLDFSLDEIEDLDV